MIARLYDVEHDAKWLHQLWHRSLGTRWSLPHERLQSHLGTASIKLVMESCGQQVAFIAAAHRPSQDASLLSVLVEPSHQRQGFGGLLVNQLTRMLADVGCSRCTLGSGTEADYFWPGVPDGEQSAWPFFAKHGFKETERTFDLLQNLHEYQSPEWVMHRPHHHGVTVGLANTNLSSKILEFESRTFPAWSTFYENALRNSQYDNLLVATDRGGTVVGSVLLNCGETLTWTHSLGADCGALSVLGVRDDQQGKGIGLALASRALELLERRGCRSCYIHWTGLASWYGKLGASVWAEYHMASRQLV